jgi:hypothetical protein
MIIQNEQLAQKVIDIFKQNISEDARAHITEAFDNPHFQDIEQAVKQRPKIPPFHLSKQSPEISSQKFDCSDDGIIN